MKITLDSARTRSIVAAKMALGPWSRPVKQLGDGCIMEPIGSCQKPTEAADADRVPCFPFARPFLGVVLGSMPA
jgi:hypothetical protein